MENAAKLVLALLNLLEDADHSDIIIVVIKILIQVATNNDSKMQFA